MKNQKWHLDLMNGIKSIFILLALLVTLNAIASSKLFPTGLTPQDQANSNQFKSLVGQDRLAVFNLLSPLIVSESSLIYAAPGSPSTLTTEAEVISLLGNPDFTRSSGLFGYYLKGSGNSCLVIFGLNATGGIQYTSVNDCR